ncbi:type I inositol polyphosphate 5-phosphatase 4-like [Neltuma alba]|uniref:type I inositol polyphosphate 5-phosphatase 4-like n=1 Tax=Neltuma alba TaxID=207710 RepID=UPI0010A2B998|nr:type I inositol polyphosphate 5-phosphatase 4-like [Prosopis alba]
MDEENQKPRSRGFPTFFIRNHKEGKPSESLGERKDEVKDESDGTSGDLSSRCLECDPCVLTNELRIFVGTWNVAGRSPVESLAVDLDEWLSFKNAADIYVLGFQEIVPLNALAVIGTEDPTVATSWNLLIGRTLNDKYGCPWLKPVLNSSSSENYVHEENTKQEDRTYTLVASKKMVGVFISVWMRQEVLNKYSISNVRACSVACGIMGYLGNKGSVAVSMLIEGTSFCFVVAHLASGEKKGDEGRRNHQVLEIFRRTCFPTTPTHHHYPSPLTILGHDRIFWFGDLNYRLYLEDSLARQLLRKQDWKALHEHDQLRKEQEGGRVFAGWKEGSLEFAPTYKYSSSNCNTYSGGLPSTSGKKQRTPAWCDRILWYGKEINQLHYFRSESKFSDHRPVSALFSTQIEIRSPSTGLVACWNEPSTISLSDPGMSKVDEEGNSTLLSLLMQDVEGCSYQNCRLHEWCHSSFADQNHDSIS